MSTEAHTYGPTCSLSQNQRHLMRRVSEHFDQPPKLRARFFHNSDSLTDDDPLPPPHPFSAYDNKALEEAWLRIHLSQASSRRSSWCSSRTVSWLGRDRDGSRHPGSRSSIGEHVSQSTARSGLSSGESRKLPTAQVPVGLSRLHMVDLPALQLKPIYWISPQDVSSVVRGTWFFKKTMYPVDSQVANQLEKGYMYMKPWSLTYADEVQSCLDNVPDAEKRVVFRLWPKGKDTIHAESPNTNSPQPNTNLQSPTAAERAFGMAVEATDNGENTAAGSFGPDEQYSECSVIYANDRDAQILYPSQLPRDRTFFTAASRPLGPIRKGKVVGIPVIRGFDYALWEKIHPSKKSELATQAKAGAQASQSGVVATQDPRNVCPACTVQEDRPKVTDLILVIHGIGQKLSEKMESFKFTHSINTLRRHINVELESGAVRPWLRNDLGGVMVLPINWRSTLSLDDHHVDEAKKNVGKDAFTLKDITIPTIPIVRDLISDVMLDIPYYLSDHKAKMVAAVTREANRVYRLWCANNPGFAASGRVHLIAHSLGSVMAVDILSNQPTQLPATLDLHSENISTTMLEFDTKSLFFCGSPAGFFLLLNKASLLPRRGRRKPGLDLEDVLDAEHEGEAGTWGCLAVDNVYNIMHKNDPIACCLNACVSVSYSKSILPATVPSSTGWMEFLAAIGLGSGARATLPATNLDAPPVRPAQNRLPSTIELEAHNFSEEEIAEKKMYRLNDNGQIDYYLSSGGGPLEIQYLNMLGAHSSYWVLRDFVRFVVVEVGREFGRDHTARGCRAVKRGWQGNGASI